MQIDFRVATPDKLVVCSGCDALGNARSAPSTAAGPGEHFVVLEKVLAQAAMILVFNGVWIGHLEKLWNQAPGSRIPQWAVYGSSGQ